MDDPPVERVCAAITANGAILMVRHVHDSRDYWTLPGGGVEPGETLEQAVAREVREEANLVAEPICALYERRYRTQAGAEVIETCFLLRSIGASEATLGYDPELPAESQILKAIAWLPLEELRDDIQVSRVRRAVGSCDVGRQPDPM